MHAGSRRSGDQEMTQAGAAQRLVRACFRDARATRGRANASRELNRRQAQELGSSGRLAPARRRPAQEGRTTLALFWQIVIFLLVAAALGFVIGWVTHGARTRGGTMAGLVDEPDRLRTGARLRRVRRRAGSGNVAGRGPRAGRQPGQPGARAGTGAGERTRAPRPARAGAERSESETSRCRRGGNRRCSGGGRARPGYAAARAAIARGRPG